MRKYQVVAQCYVPVGTGKKFKKPGQVVTLDAGDAADLEGFVVPLDEGVQKLNTRPSRTRKSKAKTPEPESRPEWMADDDDAQVVPVEEAGEVTSDVGGPGEAVQRAGTEDRE